MIAMQSSHQKLLNRFSHSSSADESFANGFDVKALSAYCMRSATSKSSD